MAKQTVENGRFVLAYVDDLADGDDFDVTPADFTVGRTITITTYIVGGACDVKWLADAGGDLTTPDLNVTIESFGGSGISEANSTPITQETTALRITNTSGGPADYAVVGAHPAEEPELSV